MKNLILSLFLIFQPMLANAAWEVTAPYTATYSAGADYFVPYATPSDICALGNPGGITIRIFHVRIWGTQTTGGINNFLLFKRSAFDTFANNTSMTAVPHDSYTQASGADVTILKAAPTGYGNPYSLIRGADIFIAAPAGLANSTYDFDFGPSSGTQPIVLHKNEMLAINFNSVAVPAGLNMSCEFTWSEQ